VWVRIFDKTPQGELEYIHYFCGNTEIPDDLKAREPQRAALYKATVALVRAYANIADELARAGYSAAEIQHIEKSLDRYLKLREIIRNASGESLDLKAYEADMRHLIDTYIEADEPRKISPFDDMPLLELIVKSGIADAIDSRFGDLKGNKEAIPIYRFCLPARHRTSASSSSVYGVTPELLVR
jgi:type I restriction enzyme, R subunit